MKEQVLCPCGLGKSYLACCGLYIEQGQAVPDAEALMRSRYTAYTQANIPYIQKTMRGSASKGFDPDSAQGWASSVVWEKLKVLDFREQDDKAMVCFKAYYSFGGKQEILSERSLFKRVDGVWYYTGSL